jgi:hypothetical protein
MQSLRDLRLLYETPAVAIVELAVLLLLFGVMAPSALGQVFSGCSSCSAGCPFACPRGGGGGSTRPTPSHTQNQPVDPVYAKASAAYNAGVAAYQKALGEQNHSPNAARDDFEEALRQLTTAEILMREQAWAEDKLHDLRISYTQFLMANGDPERAWQVINVAWFHNGGWDLGDDSLRDQVYQALDATKEQEQAEADRQAAERDAERRRQTAADRAASIHSRNSNNEPGIPLAPPQSEVADNGNGGLPQALPGNSHSTAASNDRDGLPLAPPGKPAGQGASPGERTYVPAGNGLVGGTTWIAGYYVPPGSAPALKTQAAKMLLQQTKLAGIPYNESIDFNRYNFVLGIAASTSAFTDLRRRVLFDDLTNGKSTPQMQNAYNSLRGRSFDELACHSNGAMICLAALENRDIKADRVVLYGPQLTLESLRMWQGLVDSRRIRSIQIYINQNDPVPPVSVAIGGGTVAAVPLFNITAMSLLVHQVAPGVGLKTFSCGGMTPTLDCHSLAVYKRERGCKAGGAPGGQVPGTRLSNGQSVQEPPPPC